MKVNSETSCQKKIKANKLRSLSNTLHRKRNLKLRDECKTYREKNPDLPEATADHLQSLEKKLWFSVSAGQTVYRRTLDGEFSFMGSMDSGHKLDFATNSRRSKALRRKYSSYFKRNEETGYTGKKDGRSGPLIKKKLSQEYDFFHLVLTVPHSDQGYKGKRFYAQEIMERFNVLRKEKTFCENVWGGEYSCEIVKSGENGLHIHLHVLILLKKFEQNRNIFSRWLFKKWNSLTADQTNLKDELSEEEIEGIAKVWKFSKSEIQKLKPNGALRIWFESLYVTSEVPKGRGWRLDKETGKYKKYCNRNDMDQLIYGIMECLKYHFEPFVLEDDTGGFDMDMIAEILLNIYGKPLYRKFGKFHGVKELNVNNKVLDLEAIQEELEEVAGEALHPLTGEVLGRDEYEYVCADPMYVFHQANNDNRILISKKRVIEFDDQPTNLQDAFELLIAKIIGGHEVRKMHNGYSGAIAANMKM